MKALGWDYVDVILFSGDAYVDHPSFAAAVLGRILLSNGFKVAIVPQPNWQDDLRDFKKFGAPRLYFGVSAGAMDSMVNHYTANLRKRSDDSYTPNGRPGMRPDYPTIVYTRILKELYPDTPVIIGGIEASMRRLPHYDYWQNKIRQSILIDSKADMLLYGMGDKNLLELTRQLDSGAKIAEIVDLPQSVILLSEDNMPLADENNIILHPWGKVKNDKVAHAENFRIIEQQSNRFHGATLWQKSNKGYVIKVNPMYPPLTEKEIDASFDLPYTRLPHPRYNGKTIPAYEMIKHSINLHRGCFGGCAFCTISAHQGKFISSRSKASIIKEAEAVTSMDDFKGYISDLGGPSANMYRMGGKDKSICEKCLRPSCLHPKVCPNLNSDHSSLLDIYRAVDSIPGVKKSFIGSGVRYDLSMHITGDKHIDKINAKYNAELIHNHVSGRLKVAPEHTCDYVLSLMRKPSFSLYYKFKEIFDKVDSRYNLRQQLIPYFISSHPGCTEIDMAELAVETKSLNLHLEQIQDFTPTPMTISTEMFYTGIDPYTLKPVYTARNKDEKLAQRKYFFWYDPKFRNEIISSLTRLNRKDLIARLFPGSSPMFYRANKPIPKSEIRQNKKKKSPKSSKYE